MPSTPSRLALFAHLALVLALAAPTPARPDAGTDAETPSALEAQIMADVRAAEEAFAADDHAKSAAHFAAAVAGLLEADQPPEDYAELALIAALSNLAAGPAEDAGALLALTARLPAELVRQEGPDLVEMAGMRARAMAEAGERDGALLLLDGAIEGPVTHLDPAAAFDVRALRGGLRAVMGQRDAALADLDAAVAAIPPDADPMMVAVSHANRAQLLGTAERTADALAALEQSRGWARAPGIEPRVVLELAEGRASLLYGLDHDAESGAALVEVRALLAERLGEAHPRTLQAGCRSDVLRAEGGRPVAHDPEDCVRWLHRLEWGLGHHLAVAEPAMWLARAQDARGRPDAAREALDLAVTLRSTLPAEPDALATALRRRAASRLNLGDEAGSADDLSWGMALVEAAGDPADRVMWRHDLAAVATQGDDTDAATRQLEAAMQDVADPFERMVLTFARAVLHDDTDAPEAAAPLYAAGLALLDDHPDTAYAGYWLIRAAENAQHRGEDALAAALGRRALVETERRAAMPHRWRVLSHYARLAADRDDNTVAIFHAKRAVRALQTLRGRLRQGDRFVETYRSQYEMLAGMLVERRGRLAEADAVEALLGGGALGALTRGLVDGADDIPETPAEQAWRTRYETARDLLRASDQSDGARAAFVAALDTLEADMREAEVMGARGLDFDAAEVFEAARPRLAALDAERDGKSALVQWLTVPEGQMLLITTATQGYFVASEVTRDDLNARAGALARALSNRGDWRSLSESIYADLIAPLKEVLADTGVDTLIWSLDGAMRYVPMAALVDPESGRFLIEDFALARYAPPAEGDAPRRSIDRVAAFGAAGAHPEHGLAALPSVRVELGAIVRPDGVPAAGLLPGEVWLDDAFTADVLLSTLAERAAPAVHIASHFVFRPGPASRSFLALGDGGTLGLDRLAAARFDGVELLTLSACRTAVGTFAEGQPLDGFAATAIRQGARSVVASLWPVADDSTARLMARFYAGLAAGEHKIDALRAAQLAMAGSTSSGPRRDLVLSDAPAPKTTGPHPYTWAPFVLIGDPH